MSRALRSGILIVILGLSLVLVAGALFWGPLREAYVYAPSERAVEDAMRQVSEAQLALHKSTGRFVPFAAAEVESNPTLLGLPWNTFPTGSFSFDAAPLPSGNLRLRALPRAEPVAALAIRPRIYVTELSPAGEIVRAGWLPGDA